jgi:hypothetical protein
MSRPMPDEAPVTTHVGIVCVGEVEVTRKNSTGVGGVDDWVGSWVAARARGPVEKVATRKNSDNKKAPVLCAQGVVCFSRQASGGANAAQPAACIDRQERPVQSHT